MATLTLQANLDGERVRLVESFNLPAGVLPLVTRGAGFPWSGSSPYELLANALPLDALLDSTEEDTEEDTEAADWYALSLDGLARAYGDDEPEYTAADHRP